jgi:hypothetical protein
MSFVRPRWENFCIDCALRRRSYAHSKFRMARVFQSPQMLADGKSLLRDAIEWLKAARR